MDLCENCGKLISMREDQGDYVYKASEKDALAHPYCNACLGAV